jgi:hypothetical protein
MTLDNFQIDGKSPVSQMSFMKSKRTWSAFSQNSSTQNYDPEFQKFKKQKEKTKLNFKSKNLEEYNRPFSFIR